MISAKFLWGNVLLRGKQQIGATNSNFEIFESALYMKSVSMPFTRLVKHFLYPLRFMSLISFCFFLNPRPGIGLSDLGSINSGSGGVLFVLALPLRYTLTYLSCLSNILCKVFGSCHLWSACSGGRAYLVNTGIHFTEVVRRFNCRPCFFLECAVGSASTYAHPSLEVLTVGCLQFF